MKINKRHKILITIILSIIIIAIPATYYFFYKTHDDYFMYIPTLLYYIIIFVYALLPLYLLFRIIKLWTDIGMALFICLVYSVFDFTFYYNKIREIEDKFILKNNKITYGIIYDKIRGGRGEYPELVVWYKVDNKINRTYFRITAKRSSPNSIASFSIGDTVLLRYSVIYPKRTRIYKYKPTSAEIQKYRDMTLNLGKIGETCSLNLIKTKRSGNRLFKIIIKHNIDSKLVSLRRFETLIKVLKDDSDIRLLDNLLNTHRKLDLNLLTDYISTSIVKNKSVEQYGNIINSLLNNQNIETIVLLNENIVVKQKTMTRYEFFTYYTDKNMQYYYQLSGNYEYFIKYYDEQTGGIKIAIDIATGEIVDSETKYSLYLSELIKDNNALQNEDYESE